jgi:hypothetical protein
MFHASTLEILHVTNPIANPLLLDGSERVAEAGQPTIALPIAKKRLTEFVASFWERATASALIDGTTGLPRIALYLEQLRAESASQHTLSLGTVIL